MSNQSISIHNLDANEEIVVSKRSRKKHIDKFVMIGRGEGMNSVKILAHMKPQEARVIDMIIDRLEYKTNRADLSLDRKGETPTERVQFSKGYGRLKELGVLIRIKWNVYLVNPLFILPPSECIADVKEDWDYYYNGIEKEKE